MKVQIPYYLVALLAAFLYAVVKYFVPTLPLTEDQVIFVIVAILALLNVDVVNALRSQGLLAKK